MNKRMIVHTIGRILQIQSLLFLLPLFVSLFYREGTAGSWLLCSLATLAIGKLLSFRPPEKKCCIRKTV